MSDAAPPAVEKKGKGPLLAIVLALVFGVGGAGATYALVPKAPPEGHGAEKSDTKEKKKHKEDASSHEEPPIVVQWPPLVVDVRDAEGESRHLRLVLTLEAKDAHQKKEAEAFAPRGRAAVLSYLRSRTFEELTEKGSFDELQTKLAEIAMEQMGKERVQNLWITDLVTQ